MRKAPRPLTVAQRARSGKWALFGEQLKNLPEVVAKFIKGGSLRVGAPNAGDTRDEELHFLVPFDVRRERCQPFYPLGRPRPRVAMMLRWISLVPAAIVPRRGPEVGLRLVDLHARRIAAQLSHHAQDVHAREGDALAELAAEELARACFVVRHLSLGLHRGDAIGEERAHVHLDHAVGELVADTLTVAPEVPVLLRDAGQPFDVAAADGVRPDAAALEVEGDGEVVPAAVLLAHALLDGYADILEEHLVEAVLVAHVDQRPHRDPRRLHIEHEQGDALVLGRVGIGAGGEPAPVREVAAGGPNLLAVDHVVVAVAHGAGLQGGEVAAGAGFAVEGAPPLLGARDRRDVGALLLLGAVEHERGSDPGDTHVPNGGAGVGPSPRCRRAGACARRRRRRTPRARPSRASRARRASSGSPSCSRTLPGSSRSHRAGSVRAALPRWGSSSAMNWRTSSRKDSTSLSCVKRMARTPRKEGGGESSRAAGRAAPLAATPRWSWGGRHACSRRSAMVTISPV